MASYNRVILLGNLTRDPELKYVPSGTAVSDIGLAVKNAYKNSSGEWVDEPVFVDVTLWGRTAEVASEYLSKGSPVLIEGRLKFDTWETSEGQKRSKLRVVCDRMQMLGSRGGGGGGAGGGGAGEQAPARQDSEYSQAAPPSEDHGEPPSGPSGGGDDNIPF
ncbi:MAG: single-stranded DNA-binding protein [Planctomycetota bacterium]